MPARMHGFKARWVVPVESPPIDGGVVVVADDRIADVGRPGEISHCAVEDLGDVILLPGFVNAHTHLELSHLAGMLPPQPLWDWFEALLDLLAVHGSDAEKARAIEDGAARAIAAGVTCVGDISRTGLNASVLAASPIRKVCFIELISGAVLAPSDCDSLARLVTDARPFADPDSLLLGVSPHSPYAVCEADLAGLVNRAARDGLRVTMHLLETLDELAWFRGAPSALTAFQRRRGLLRRDSPGAASPEEYLQNCGLLRLAPLFAHVNYPTDGVIAALGRAGAGVAWCPRSHAYFGHPPHRWREMLAAGVSVCIATDSLASAPSLSILDELRFVRRQSPDADPAVLVEMGTLRGARALGLEDRIGSLRPGKLADLAAVRFDLSGAASPLANLHDGGGEVTGVWIGGRRFHPRAGPPA